MAAGRRGRAAPEILHADRRGRTRSRDPAWRMAKALHIAWRISRQENEMSTDPSDVQEWLRRLKWSLASMPSPERDDILAEARAHIDEALASGKTPAQALSGFGPPEEYAR